MRHWKPAKDYLEHAAEALRQGQLVGMPTETVYGLAGNAHSAEVVASIFSAKGRPTFDPLIVHALDTEAAFAMAAEVPEAARQLAERFWPGPLTLVLPRKPDMPDLLSAGLSTMALRVPAHPVARQLLATCGLPLAAPSANRFGHISPTCAEHVIEELGDVERIAGVLDAGPCTLGVESTVVGFPEPGRIVVYRLGGLPLEELREMVDGVEWVEVRDAEDDPELAKRGEQSPGMLARHYAPGKPLHLLSADAMPPSAEEPTGWLLYDHGQRDRFSHLSGPVEILSPGGNLNEAATRLFACMRSLDAANIRRIVAWRVPDEGLGRAINDRLSRAAISTDGLG
ncbi:MAG: threonylcarbamoyl-AMP synthase [Verrucomicrobia bacterium]|nr:threonylcarbamoyl-AMP synthase [Verrucomicrobiota bacterium]MCH8511332.1 threonylcarbamoyl-AMP synthase [Kiritimatiellia bacterium]